MSLFLTLHWLCLSCFGFWHQCFSLYLYPANFHFLVGMEAAYCCLVSAQRWATWCDFQVCTARPAMEPVIRGVAQMTKSAEGSAGLVHKISKPTAWRGGAQILGNEEEDARLLDPCEAKMKEWANIGSVMRRCRMWRESHGKNEVLKKLEKPYQG